MKKRVLSLVLAMILIVALLPTAAFAATNGKTADDAINWVKSQNGKQVGNGECVALIYAYYSYLGQTSPGGDGKDYWTNKLPAGWTRIANAQPQKGDILVYGGNAANPAGHVAIYEADYSTWHQNFGTARYVVQVTQYRYNGFTNPYLGVIRPDFSSGAQTPTFANIGTNIYRYLIRTDGWKHIGTNYDSSDRYNVTISKANTGDPEQIWKFIRQSDGSYYIQNMFNDNYLTYVGDCVQQAKVRTDVLKTQQASRFQWYIVDKNGTFQLVPKDSVTAGTWLVLDCTGNYQTAGTQMELYANWSGAAQIFSLYPVENYQKPAAPPKVEITVPSEVTAGEEFTISWTESPLQGKYDQREYRVTVGGGGSKRTYYTTDTRLPVTMKNADRSCYMSVEALNTKYSYYASSSSTTFRCVRAQEHEHSYNAVVTAPTCTAQGYTTHTCTCGDSYVDTYVNALGHNWNSGVVTKPATATETGIKTFTCTRCGTTKTETIPAGGCPSAGFTDVPGEDRWEHAGIDYCLSYGLMSGMGDGIFAPGEYTTRAQVAQILYNLHGKPSVSGGTPFTDVPEGAWYQKAVAWAYSVGVVNGTTATTFAPSANITRQDFVLMLMRYMNNVRRVDRTWTPDDLSRFADAGSVGSWALTAMKDAVAINAISGVTVDGRVYIQPTRNATRAEVAKILMKFHETMTK